MEDFEDLENFVFANVQYEVTKKQLVLRVNEKVSSEALSKIKSEYEKDANTGEANRIASMFLKIMHKPVPPDSKATWQPWKNRLDLILNDDTLSGLAPNQHKVLYAVDPDGTYKFVSPELLSNEKYLSAFVGLLEHMIVLTKISEKYNQ